MSSVAPSDSTTPVLGVSALRFGYNDQAVLDIEDFTLAQGESLAVIGPSGCGKTLLAESLMSSL